MRRIQVFNYTNFFNRELFMYSLGDIKFKKPVSLKKVGYTTMFLLVWALPFFMMWGVPKNPFVAAWMLGIPLAAGHFAAKPVFGGKGLADYVKTLFHHKFNEPKGWADGNPLLHQGPECYYVNTEMWISRRRELKALQEGRLQDLK